ncbi:MAG: MFS transporter [Micrococcaceae bacterium]
MSQVDEEFSLRKIAVPAFGPSILFGIAEGALFPVIPATSTSLGASLALSSLIVSIIGIGSMLANIPASIFTHKFGEKIAIIGASLISALACAIMYFIPHLAVFMLANVLIGIAQAVFNLARQAYLTEMTPISKRATALSTLGGSYRVGVFLGPFLGAAVMHFMGVKGAYIVGFIASLVALLIAVTLPDLVIKQKPINESTDFKYILHKNWKVFSTIGVGIMCISAMRACRQVIIPLWGHYIGLNPETVSIIYGVSASIDMLLFYPAGIVMDRFGRAWVTFPSMIVMALGFLIMPFTHGVVSLSIVAFMLGLGNGISSGLIMTLGSDYSPVAGRAKFLGIWRFMQDLGSSSGPFLVSVLTSVASLTLGVSSVGVLGLVAIAMIGYWTPRLPRK